MGFNSAFKGLKSHGELSKKKTAFYIDELVLHHPAINCNSFSTTKLSISQPSLKDRSTFPLSLLAPEFYI